MNLVTKPTENHLNQLREWLITEENETGEGFFCNWNIIYKTFTEERLFIVESDSLAIALLVWWEYPPKAGIEILTVEPKHRKKGIGRYLVNSFIELIKKKNVTTIEIQSEPATSESFWLSLGFKEKADKRCKRINGIPMQNLYMYKELNESKL